MALRNFDNSNTARIVSTVNDGGLENLVVNPVTERIVVIGMFNNDDAIDVQELYPVVPGSVTVQELISQTYNKTDDANPLYYPSEVSLALEELARAGVENVQVIRAADDARLFDASARMVRQRYVAYESAYELLLDVPVDYIYSCNVVAGRKGDGLYNANTAGDTSGASVEFIYDPARYTEISTASLYTTAKALTTGWVAADISAIEAIDVAGLPGFVAGAEADFTKGDGVGVNEPEDLVYQLADACYTLSTNGNYCIGTTRTMNPVEFNSILEVKLGQTGGAAGTDYGVDVTDTYPVITADGSTWSLGKLNSTETIYADFPDLNTTTTADADLHNGDILTALEESAYIVTRSTNTGGVKDVYQESTQPAGGTTYTYVEALSWKALFGTPTTSTMRAWQKFLNTFGNVDFNSVASFIDLDGVTDTDNDGVADGYRFYATANHEKPASEVDAANILDNNSKPVDLGVYLDVIAANSASPAGSNSNLVSNVSVKAFTNAAGIGQVIGWYATVPSNRATTRLATTGVVQLGSLGGRATSDLTRNRFQVFFNEDGTYRLSRDITMGKFVNNNLRTNFINRFTTRVVKDAVDVASIEGKKYLGRGETPEVRAAIKQTLEQEYARWAAPEDGRLTRPAVVTVLSDGTDAVIGRLVIQLRLAVASEILEIAIQTTLER